MATGLNGTMRSVASRSELLEIPAITLKTVRLRIVGDSELIVHAWSEKARREMLDKQTGRARVKKEAKDPQADYEAAFYRLPDGRPGFPTLAFKSAVVDAATQAASITKTFLRGILRVDGELVAIEGDPYMREDMVRVGAISKVADVRHRPGFPYWSCTLTVRYMANAITLEQLVHLFNLAGFAVGVGEWRPQRDGQFGTFHVESVEEVYA